MNRKPSGQALIELTISLPIIGLLMVWGLSYIQGALQERVQAQQMAQLALAQGDERRSFNLPLTDTDDWNMRLRLWINMSKWMVLYPRGDYPFAYATAPLELLARYEQGLQLTNQNLWDVEIAEYGHFEWMRYQRLRDDWSPRTAPQLAQRPARLTGSQLLDNGLVRTLQTALASTPMGRELRPTELIFGHVDTDVVPSGVLCSDPNRTVNCN